MSPASEETSSGNHLVQCYNKGCGKKFNPRENTAGTFLYFVGENLFKTRAPIILDLPTSMTLIKFGTAAIKRARILGPG